MKTLFRGLLFLFATSALAQAEIWVKPPYKPDENHLPRETMVPREAQEEKPTEISRPKQHQEEKKINGEKALDKIDDEMSEGLESHQ